MDGVDDWKGVFIVFFGRACQLLVSVTFWHSIGLWGVLAIGVCMYHTKRERARQSNYSSAKPEKGQMYVRK